MKLNIDKKNIWQIGSGDSSRDYSNVFLNFGVALVGPGHPGDQRNIETEKHYKENTQLTNWGKVLNQVKKGDWIILRAGQRIIKAVGEVVSDYQVAAMYSFGCSFKYS